MTAQPDTQPIATATEHTWGAPQPTPGTWSARKTAAAVGVAAVIAAGGGAAIYAATSGASNNAGGPGGMGGPGMFDGAGGPQGAGSAAASLHGEFVVANRDGGFSTELTQTGTVTAISATEVTATSADDYSRTYVIDAGTSVGTIAVGDTATIRATVVDGTATIATITEGALTPGTGTGPMGGPGGSAPGVPAP